MFNRFIVLDFALTLCDARPSLSSPSALAAKRCECEPECVCVSTLPANERVCSL